MKPPVLLDSSFLIALERETAKAEEGPARRFLPSLRGRRLVISVRRCALLQRRASRRLGENDAWLLATAQLLNADVVSADRRAFARLGARYIQFDRTSEPAR